MTLYPCPRDDLACHDAFPTTGDLDYHLHLVHGYRGLWRIVSSLRPETALPVGPKPARHVPDGLELGPGTPALGTGPAATRAAVTARPSHRRASRPTATRR